MSCWENLHLIREEDEDGNVIEHDVVNKPLHYNHKGVECINAIEASMEPSQFKGYLKGNIIKYLWRYEYKNGVEDLKKAQWYLNKLITTWGE